MVLPRTRVDDLENYVELCGTPEKYLKIADEIWKTHLKQCNYVQLCATSKLHVGFHASSRGSMGNHWAETSEPNEKQYGNQNVSQGHMTTFLQDL